MNKLYVLLVAFLVLCLPLKSEAELILPAAEDGLSCETAALAVEGTNSIANTQGDNWYHFTMPREGKLDINSQEYTNIFIYGNNCGNLEFLKNAGYGLSVSGLAAGDEVYIKITTYNTGSFNWSLAVSEYGAGDLCGLAVTAVQGTNTVPTNYGEYWFRFTMPRDGKFKITSASNERLNVFSGSCENLLYKDYGYGVVSVAGLLAGDEVYVSWLNQYGGNFDWELSLEDNAEGDMCRTAITAVEGANSIPAGLGDYWTRFTMPKEGKLRITSEMGRSFSVYKNSCESPEFLKDGYNSVSVAGLEAGEVVFLKWTENRTEGFSWSLAVEDHSEGDFCSLPLTAVEGENNVLAGNGEFWYRFTLPKAGKLMIESGVSGRVILYKSNSCAELYDATYGQPKVSKAGMEAGDEVLIYWESYFSPAGFSWNLSVGENEEGDLCKLAAIAAEGENVAPDNTGEYWYRFAIPKEGNLVITTEQYNNVEVFAQSCDNLHYKGSGHKNLSLPEFQPGEEVFIKWRVYAGKSFSWNLAVTDHAEGDICSMAVTAVEGANTVPESHGKYWFRFIMPKEGKLSVNTDIDEYTRFYKNNCEDLSFIKSGYRNASLTGLAAGEEVYINWDNRLGGNFSWDLVVEDYTEGDLCSMAIPAAEGDHFLPATNGDYWYRFVMPKDGKINITTQNWNSVTVYSNNCEQLHYKKEGHGDISVAGLLSGEVIYILQSKDSGGDFSWNLKVEENEAGDICSLAIAAAEGENLISENGMDYWSAFSMPVNGRLIITPDAYRYFQVFKNSCDNYQNSGSEKTVISNLAVGDQVLIKWSVQDSQTSGYNLAVEEPLPGEVCNMAAEAVSGINTVPAVVTGEYWYTYTVPQDGRLILTSETSNYVSVYGNSCELSYRKGGASGNFAADNFYAGETVLVRWDNNSGESFNWNLATEGYAEGEICTLAVQAIEGSNTVPLVDQTDYHFNFIMPRDGKLIITSESTARVNISTGNCTYGNTIGSGMTRIVGAGVEVGENVNILWRNIGNNPFDWNLAIEEHEEGDLCSSAFVAVEGENTAPASQDDKWFRYSMPKDGKVKISSTADNKASLYRGNCEYDRLSGHYNPVINPEMGSIKKGEIVFIKWTNSTGEAFIWNLSVEDNQPGESCNLAVYAVEGENQLPESFKGSFWYKFIMPAEGRLNIASEASNPFWVWKGSGCDYQQFVNYGVGSIVTGSIPEGETVYLNWEGIDGNHFIWNLSVEEVSPGGKCELAFAAAEGENHMPQSSSDQWFSFTLPRDGKLVVDSPFGGYLYKGSCGEKIYIKSLDGTPEIPGLKAGETVYFHWSSDQRMAEHDFNYWNISVEENEVGDLCANAFLASEGENYFPATNEEMWYQFTMPKDGRIEITSSAFFSYSLYSGTCENQELTQQFHRQLTAGGLTVGETYLIKIWGPEGAPMIWNLAVEDNQPGDNCELAHTAVLGTNHMPAVYSDQWFSFVMPSEGILAVNFQGYQGVEIFTGDCGSLIKETYDWPDIKLNDIASGETVYFKWDARRGTSFRWFISVESPEGADCETTITAAEGNNEVVASGFAEQWYSFTMPVNGHLSVSNTESRQLSLYEGGCGVLTLISAGIGNTAAQNLTLNTIYFIKAETFPDKGYDFNITVTGLKERQSISFAKINDQLFSSGSLTLSATASSGLPVSFEVRSGTATVSGNTLSFTTAGEVTVTALQEGNSAYLPAEPVSQTFCVNPDKPLISAENGAELKPGVTLVSDSPTGNQWFRGGVKIEGAVYTTYPANEAGLYTVQVAQGSCTGIMSEGAEVKKAAQTISLPPVETEKIVLGEPFVPGGTSASGLPLRYEVESGAASISEEGYLIIQGPGPVTLVAYQDGNESYEEAEAVRTTFCVPPAKPVISVENKEAASLQATLVSDSQEGNQWYLNGEIIEGAVNQSYRAEAEGSYAVEVKTGGCVGPVSESLVITGLGEKLKASALKVFPNPTAGLVRVEFASKKGTEAIKVKLVNASGTEIYLPVQPGALQNHKFVDLDISSLAAGIYYVLISDGEILTRAKVFKK